MRQLDAKTIRHEIKDIYKSNMTRGFIGWRDGGYLVNDINYYFMQNLRELLLNKEYDLAFEMVHQTMYMLEKVEMDGSNGEHAEITYTCTESLKLILEFCTLEQKRKYFKRLEKLSKMEKNVNIIEPFFIDILDLFTGKEFVSKKIKYYKERIEEEKDSNHDYALRESITNLLNLYKGMNAEDEMVELYEEWKHLDEIKLLYAKYLTKKGNSEYALKLLYEGEKVAEYDSHREKFSNEIKEIYKNSGDNEAIYNKIIKDQKKYKRVEYKDYLFVKEYNPEKWESIKNDFIESLPKDKNYVNALFEEEMFDNLKKLSPDRLKQSKKVWEYMKTNYSEVFLDLYEEDLFKWFDRAHDRPSYKREARGFRKFLEIPGGEERAKEVANKLIEKYDYRPAMIDEINKAIEKLFK